MGTKATFITVRSLLAFGLLCSLPARPQSYSFTPIGGCQPNGINDEGVVVGQCNVSLQGFIFFNGTTTLVTDPLDPGQRCGIPNCGWGYSTLPVPNSIYTYPAGINDQQTISGWYTDQNNYAHGFVLKNGAVTTIDYPGADFTRLGGINQHRLVVGFAIVSGSIIGFEATPAP